jgi:hypothetical protein
MSARLRDEQRLIYEFEPNRIFGARAWHQTSCRDRRRA